MGVPITKGSTSQSVYVMAYKLSDGTPFTGLAYNTSGLVAYYALNRGAATAITLATLAAATSAYSSGGFKEVDATNMPGLYRIDLPNAALTGADKVTLIIRGVTDLDPISDSFTLTGMDFQNAVNGGMSAIVQRISKNTAFNAFPFLMLDSADHLSGKTGLTVTATRSIDGGAFAACTNSPTEVASGMYKINLSAADLNGDSITLKFSATGADTRLVVLLTQNGSN